MDKETRLVGFNNENLFLGASSIGMMATSIYLFWHYYAVKFPVGIVSSSFCEINSFISCNAVAYSPISSVFGIPISVFGFLNGLFVFYNILKYSREKEEVNAVLIYLNFLGCIVLCLLSIFVFKHLCPVCFLYYIFSTITFILYLKYSCGEKKLYPQIAGIYVLIAAVFAGSSAGYTAYKKGSMTKHADTYIKQFYSYPSLGAPTLESPYRIHSATKNFQDAPIQMSIFSDFQCPACGFLAKLTNQIIARYRNDINIQFYFYPLDSKCNQDAGMVHPHACKSSYLSACLPEKFHKVHDDIFEAMPVISDKWLDDYAKKEKVYECMNDMKTKETVVSLVNVGNQFNIRATPTFILNGVKIEGVLPIGQLTIILDEIVRRYHEKR